MWLGLIRRAGFKVRAHAVLEHPEPYSSALDFLRTLHDSGVTGEPRFNAGSLRRLLKDYTQLCGKPDGSVVATWAWLMVDAAV